MTLRDDRALALIARHGRASAVHGRVGHWVAGASPIAQATVKRLLVRGLVERDPVDLFRVVRITEKGRSAAASLPPFDPRTEGLPDRGESPRFYPIEDLDDEDPPDYRDGNDDPVPLDRIIK